MSSLSRWKKEGSGALPPSRPPALDAPAAAALAGLCLRATIMGDSGLSAVDTWPALAGREEEMPGGTCVDTIQRQNRS